MTRGRVTGVASLLLALGLGVAATVAVIMRSQALPSGPEPVVWDRTQCAECRMSVSERAYAAQLQTESGEVFNFDDPGCLFRYELRSTAPVHAVWFHHASEERWLAAAEVGFIASGPSPMGYDLGAVEAGAPGAVGLDEIRARFAEPDGGAQEEDHGH